MKGRGFPWSRLLLVLLVFVAGFFLHDVRTHGSFQGKALALRAARRDGEGRELRRSPERSPSAPLPSPRVCRRLPSSRGPRRPARGLCGAGRSRQAAGRPRALPSRGVSPGAARTQLSSRLVGVWVQLLHVAFYHIKNDHNTTARISSDLLLRGLPP